MFTVAKRKLKTGMSAYFRRVERTGEEMVVTDRRRPVLRVSPIREKRAVDEVFADLRGKVQATAAELCAPTQGEWGEA
jgi:antitoxin (DNA-binding transcriptional repressor) of toxin-antitoxin stability system